MAEVGHTVVCVDVDTAQIAGLKKGVMPIYETGLEELVKRNMKAGRLTFTTDIVDAIRESEVVFSAVGTPEFKATGAADLRYVKAVAKEFGLAIDGYKVFVTKSTVPVGTGAITKAIIHKASKGRHPFDVVSNPEFLREGTAVMDFLEPDRIVTGVESDRAKAVLEAVYRPFTEAGRKLLFTDIKSAEIIKYASNAFLATKISFINDIANVCALSGADVRSVAAGMGFDTRINRHFLRSGVGYGGACFPKDVKALVKTAEGFGHPLRILEAVEAVNADQKLLPVVALREHFKSLKGRTVAVWGLAFKPDTDDVREAPAFVAIRSLVKAGVRVRAYDPIAIPNTKKQLAGLPVTYTKDALGAVRGAEALLLITEWKEFLEADYAAVRKAMKGGFLFDRRNALDGEKMRSHGFDYRGIGTH